MAKYGSSSFAVLLAGGYSLLAAAVQGVTYKDEAITEMTHGLGDSAEVPTAVGVKKYTLTQSGAFFDDTTNSIHDAFDAGVASSNVLCFTVAGNTLNQPFVGCLGALTVAYEVVGQVSALTKANATYAVSGHAYTGQIVQPLATKTADWNTDTLNTPADYTLHPQTVIPITSNSQANPTVVTCPVAHGLTTGQVILISGVTGSDADINGEQTVTVVDTTCGHGRIVCPVLHGRWRVWLPAGHGGQRVHQLRGHTLRLTRRQHVFVATGLCGYDHGDWGRGGVRERHSGSVSGA